MSVVAGQRWPAFVRGPAAAVAEPRSARTILDQAPVRADRRQDIDGLRAIAALAVLAYHALLAAGIAELHALGFWGVAGFFALSGYLISHVLITELQARGRVDVRRFWSKRLRRLLPALVVVIVAVTAWESAVGQGDVRRSVVALLPWSNLLIRHGDAVGPLTHVWSLAIEAQVYLAWPLLLPWVAALARPWLWLSLAAAGIVVWRATLPEVEAYFGTLARLDAFLAGSAVALSGRNRVTLPVIGRLAPIGIRSYGLYLWHVPILFLLSGTLPVWSLVALSGAAAMLSWRYVERPSVRKAGQPPRPDEQRPPADVPSRVVIRRVGW